MTKQDFTLIAGVLADVVRKDIGDPEVTGANACFVGAFATELEKKFPAFNRRKFVEASWPGEIGAAVALLLKQ